MNKEDASYYLFDLELEMIYKILNEWKEVKGTDQRMKLKKIKSKTLIKEWKYNRDTSQVHPKIIDKFQEIIQENYLILVVNTILFGHTPLNPYHYVADYYDDVSSEEEFENFMEDFEWYACDDRGNWLISDYGLEEIGNLVVELLCSEDYNYKLYVIDKILNVVHQRSDLAAIFVDGGSISLYELSN